MNTETLTSYSALAEQQESRSSFRMFVLYGLLLVMVGRVQEIFRFLAPFRLALVFLFLSIPVAVKLFNEGKFKVWSCEGKTSRFLLGFCAATVCSLIASNYTMASVNFLVFTLLANVLLCFFLANFVRSMAEVRKIVWLLTFIIVSLSIPALTADADRWTTVGSSYDPNDTALLIVTILPFVYYLSFQTTGVFKLFLRGSVLLLFTAFVATGSRGGMVGMAAVIFVMICQVRRFTVFKKLLIFIAIGLVFFLLVPQALKDRIALLGTEADYNITDKFGRKQIWERNLPIVLHNPLFGIGPGCFIIENGFLFAEEVGGASWKMTAHNSYLLVAVETGLTGLVLYVAFLGSSVVQMRRIRLAAAENPALEEHEWVARALEAAMTGFMVCAFFLSFAYYAIPFAVTGLGMAYMNILASNGLLPRNDHDSGENRAVTGS